MNEEKVVVKKQWTEKERSELAAKLDSDLEAFIDGLEKKRYDEGWPEDRWQEEMEKHPFFMKKAPQPGDEVHPMFEGLQKLKYDPEENTAEDLALNYKDDGNFYVKHKKYRMAICSYTEGLKAKCDKPEVQAVLYNNRSAAHYFLKNYRSALSDAQKALEYKTDYDKARWRAVQCALELKRYDVGIQLCEEILEKDVNNKNAQEFLRKTKQAKLEKERNERKELKEAANKKKQMQRLCKALEERKVKCDDQKPGQRLTTDELLKPKFLPLEDYPVRFDEDNKTLLWPVAFCYPEFLYSDFLQQLSEEATMADAVKSLFDTPFTLDKTNSYRPDTVNVYYENRKLGRVHKVHQKKTIREILQEESFFVSGGSLQFYVVPKNSKAEEDFIKQERFWCKKF